MNTKYAPNTKQALLTVAAALAVALSGCGGGGGGITNKTLSGLLLDFQRAPIAGARVVYDLGTPAAQTTATNADGHFVFVLPLSSLTGSDTLSYYDAAGHLIDREAVQIDRTTFATTVTTVAPPAPPAPQV